MNYSYHNHTCFCDHASGTMRQYVQRAIDCSVKYFGFSEHCPLLVNGVQDAFRIQMEDTDKYFENANKLQKEFADKIEIIAGFEMEYYEDYFESMLQTVKELGAQYLILGQHYFKRRQEGGMHAFHKNDDVAFLEKYCDSVVKAIKTGVFSYVAHPDMVYFVGDIEAYKNEMKKICIASKEYNIPLEINCQGIREKRIYPRKEFWQLAAEYKSPVTIGFDAHEAKYAYDGESEKIALKMIEELKLNYVGKPKIIPIKK